ncbi:TPA: hypothetical protein ACIR47_001188 [Klebsiella aerogenes]
MNIRILFVFLAVLFISGCAQKTLDERIAEAQERNATQTVGRGDIAASNKQNANSLVRLECKTKVGTRISALMNGASQSIIINGALFRFIDRIQEEDGSESLMFGRIANGEKSVIFIEMDSYPIFLTMFDQKMNSLRFECQPFRE